MDNLRNILGVTILEKRDRRIVVSYNDNGSLSKLDAQLDFEKSVTNVLNNLYQKSEGETHVLTLQGRLLVVNIYKDFYVVLVAEENENEIILSEVLQAIHGVILHFSGKDLSARSIYRYYGEMAIMLNEVLDNGLILTTDSEDLVAKVLMQDGKRGKTPTVSSGKSGVMSFFSFS